MNRVGMNIVIGTIWVTVAIWMFMTRSAGDETEICAAILAVLGIMFYWSAYRIFLNPNLAKKNKKNLVQKMTDPSAKKKK